MNAARKATDVASTPTANPVQVQTASSFITTTRTTATATLGTAATAGNLLVAFFATQNITDAAPTAPAGWTPSGTVLTVGVAQGYALECYKTAAGGETGITLSWTTASVAMLSIEEWTGMNASPLDSPTYTAATAGATSNTTVTATESATPATVKSVGFSFTCMINGGTGTINASTWGHDLTNTGTLGIIISSTIYPTNPGAAPSNTDNWTSARRLGNIICNYKGLI